jgi:hypothetical protein
LLAKLLDKSLRVGFYEGAVCGAAPEPTDHWQAFPAARQSAHMSRRASDRPKHRPEDDREIDHSAENSHRPPPMGERMPLMLRESKAVPSPSRLPQSPACNPEASPAHG